MNILICSVGRRVKLIEYFKKGLNQINGKVIAVDCDSTAPALYHADHYEVVPRITHPDYIHHIKSLCEKYNISGVLSLIDPELSLLASVKDELENIGTHVVVSDKEVVDICYDKYLTSKFLQYHELPYVPTYIDMEKVIEDLNTGTIKFPLIVKPKNGSASLGINKVNSIKELKVYQDETEEFIVQPFIDGEEFGVDCYIDLINKETTNIFMKRKITMRAGETDKSIAIKDPKLKQLIEKLIEALNPSGPIDIDCFKTNSGYVISEINPRFGGGYLHAHEMGQNFINNIINNLKGVPNAKNEGDYEEGTTLVKYDHFIVL
jgi:carbamoyl-phosphate synthase large subunit